MMQAIVSLHVPAVVGYRDGLRQPAQRIRLKLGPLISAIAWAKVDAWLDARLDVSVFPNSDLPELPQAAADAAAWAWRVLLTAAALLRYGGVPVFEPGRLLDIARAADGGWELEAAIPQLDYLPERHTQRAYEAASILISGLAAHPDDFANAEPLYRQLESQVVGPIWRENSGSHAVLALLQAVHANGIAFRHLGMGIYQLGWGCHQRRIQNGRMESDSPVGARISADKQVTALWLRRAGLPAPEHLLVGDEASAIAAMQQLGGSVVLKPADSMGGQGVTLNVRTPEGVRAAFARASAVSKRVLVERQVAGVVHHIQMVRGEVVFVTRRYPASVQGDGLHSIIELVAQENARLQTIHLWRRPPPLPLDELAISCLAEAGYRPDDILPAGVWGALRDAPSNADGARVEDVTDQLHPENAALAVRAARLLKLELAGVDLISPDISVPWHENGAVINEINSTVQWGMGTVAPARMPEVVSRLVAGGVRVEVCVGGARAMQRALARQQALNEAGSSCFLSSHVLTLTPDGNAWPMALSGVFHRARALLMDRRVQALVLVVQTDEWLQTGLPVDRMTLLDIVDAELTCAATGHTVGEGEMDALLRLLRQHAAAVEGR